MIVLICNNFAHKATSNNQILSAPVKINKDGTTVISNKWELKAPEDMNLTWGDVATITDYINMSSQALPPEDAPLPKSVPQKPQEQFIETTR